jgi:ketosteroid isomerase-like protein
MVRKLRSSPPQLMRGPLGSEKDPRSCLGVPTDNPAALNEIRHVHDAWIAAELRGDMETVLHLCTPDVRWLVPGRPIMEGREAGRQLLQAPQIELLALRTTDIWVEQSGDLACKTSRYETRYRTGKEEKIGRGTHLWILRRHGAVWRVALVTWQAEE